jgi:hypothetical protein
LAFGPGETTPVSISLDPEFFVPPGSGYSIEYSMGVTQAASSTPEPGTTWEVLLGAGFLFAVSQIRGRALGNSPAPRGLVRRFHSSAS